ncbi:MAG: 3-deoxy-manno-octulosonate cytidylyltransferase [Calditrichaeota bacterium]|nr:MAG: 3-deoxy-manno-octulosonate cytidylyltransferase [Calditrichota bacterium]
MNDDVAVIIPARYGSKRLPGKPLISLAGKPLVLHVLDRAREIPSVSRVIVATDDERIMQAVLDAGEEAMMTPNTLPSGSDRVGWIAKRISAGIVVNLQGDEPLIDTAAVHHAIEVLQQEKDVSVSSLGYPLKDKKIWQDTNVVKVLTDENDFALYFSRQPIPFFRDGHFKPLPNLFRHLGVYIFRRDMLLKYVEWNPSELEKVEKLEQLRILQKGYKIKIVTSQIPSFGVDTPQDAEMVARLIEQKGFLSE